MFVSLVGLGMHVVILQATLRADSWIKYLDERLVEFEQLDGEDPNSVRVKVFSHPDFDEKRHSWLASRRIFGIFGLLISAIWIWQTIRYIRPIVGL